MISTATTIIFLAAITLVVVIYDIAAEMRDNDFSISFVLASSARKAPVIALAIGIIVGHWFWGQCLI